MTDDERNLLTETAKATVSCLSALHEVFGEGVAPGLMSMAAGLLKLIDKLEDKPWERSDLPKSADRR